MTRVIVFYDYPNGLETQPRFPTGKIKIDTNGSALGLIFQILAGNYYQELECPEVPDLRALLVDFREPEIREAMLYATSLLDLGVRFNPQDLKRILDQKIPNLTKHYEHDVDLLEHLVESILFIIKANPHPDSSRQAEFSYECNWT